MAEFAGAIATSHAPPLFIEPEYWTAHSDKVDRGNPELISPRTGKVTSYEALVAEVAVADPGLPGLLTMANFKANYARMQAATESLRQTLRQARPDAVLVISDDQEEILFDDNMPAFSVYWGADWTLLPWTPRGGPGNPILDSFARGWGDRELKVPVDTELAEHVIRSLTDDGFDIAHFRYMRDEYGGTVGPSGYVTEARTRPAQHHGMPHGFAYIVKTIMQNESVPIVPVFINTCYPPNRPTPRRCYDFGAAVRRAIDSFGPGRRVLLAASGGLSHFVLDEELDRLLLRGLEHDDRAILESLPRLDSPTGEIRNWIAAGGACSGIPFDLIDYVPTPRSPAGTGGGWGFARWLPAAAGTAAS
jgi:hypothetical protein